MLKLIISILGLTTRIKEAMCRTADYPDREYYDGQKCDIYCPKTNPDPSYDISIIMYVHGGGWITGNNQHMWVAGLDRQEYDAFPIVAINYGLAGENKPAGMDFQLNHIVQAVQWIKANKESFGGCLNYNKIVCFGESAGGHLCSWLGTVYGTEKIDKVVDYYGPTDFWASKDYNACAGDETDKATAALFAPMGSCDWPLPTIEDFFIFGGNGKRVVDYQYPETYTTESNLLVVASPAWVAMFETDVAVPPFFIVHGDSDEVVDYWHSLILYHVLKNERHYDPIYLSIVGGGHVCLTDEMVSKTVAFLLCGEEQCGASSASAVKQLKKQIALNPSVVEKTANIAMMSNPSVAYGIFMMMASFWCCF